MFALCYDMESQCLSFAICLWRPPPPPAFSGEYISQERALSQWIVLWQTTRASKGAAAMSSWLLVLLQVFALSTARTEVWPAFLLTWLPLSHYFIILWHLHTSRHIVFPPLYRKCWSLLCRIFFLSAQNVKIPYVLLQSIYLQLQGQWRRKTRTLKKVKRLERLFYTIN